ncbi:SGNH hydrolase-type esterase domain-containing protein [Lophiotrema nucula]|uniref:SGNH hydrolase-type esterase domain-containing protein n=1 Tax=Lophiotrema nucula TaxID=690887 RepID=A0A6A5Z7S1_9PLEO|nr:SGNH hydrolase-type esterase domain-containing protein [Lophiotrema nucula]
MRHSFRCIFLQLLLSSAFAFPLQETYDNYTTYDAVNNGWTPNPLAPRQTKRSLRILPLGASITEGQGPPIRNGYRKPLRDQLRYVGHEVNMIGCLAAGDFKDNQHSGFEGLMVDAIVPHIECTQDQKPNVVLINAGSNDCIQAGSLGGDAYVAGIADRMQVLLDTLFNDNSGVTVILSTILQNGDTTIDRWATIGNAGLRALVPNNKRLGRSIYLAEMHNGFLIQPTDFWDDTHPNSIGYAKMAAVWADAISKAESTIQDPIDTGIPDSGGACLPAPGNFFGPHQTQGGSGAEDGTYIFSQTASQVVVKDSVVLPSGVAGIAAQYHFAQIVNGGGTSSRIGAADDLVRIIDKKQDPSGSSYANVAVKVNGKWDEDWIALDTKLSCPSGGVHFGDMNNDGLDDFICLTEPHGDMYVSINRGGSIPTFDYIGLVQPGAAGTTPQNIRLGDIDGDGRLDYCTMDSTGSFGCWRNGGVGDAPSYWQGIAQGGGATFDGKGTPDTYGTRLVDINGDFKADWVYVYPDGHTRIFVNQRGTKADGPGIKPVWRESSGAHPAPVRGDSPLNRDFIKFGRVWATGKADYIRVHESSAPVGSFPYNVYNYTFEVWQNTGIGGTKLRGDGVRYCDVFGRGKDDYMWVWSDGRIYLFGNEGGLPAWHSYQQVIDIQRPRKSIHVGDWNGDGKCDILSVTADGQVELWTNIWVAGQATPTWSGPKIVSGSARCTEDGVGIFDIGPRFADIDGDGRVDFLCMEKEGRTTGWLNTASGMVNVGQVKLGLGLDRANFHFADVNADGRADLLHVDKFTGDVRVYRNNGKIPSSGSSFQWELIENAWMKGPDRGANMHFARMGPLGQMDYVQVLPLTNVAYAWYNQCSTGGDDGPITDPHLPALPDNGGDPPSVICPRATKCGQWPQAPHVVAFGDSYGAGIGAGDLITDNRLDEFHVCLQGKNAAPRYLFNSEPDLRSLAFEFNSCTGDIIEQVNETPSGPPGSRSHSQIELLNQEFSISEYSVMLLSIGGNNVGFSQVAISCLIAWELSGTKCEARMAAAEAAVKQGTDEYNSLHDKLVGVYTSVLTSSSLVEKWLFVTGYARFFAEEDDEPEDLCAQVSLGPVPGGAKPTRDKRVRINAAVLGLNALIQKAIVEAARQHPEARIRFIDIDPFFDGYRWCDKDERGEFRDKGDTFFFVGGGNDMEIDPNSGTAITKPRGPPDPNPPGWSPNQYDCSDIDTNLDASFDQEWYCYLQAQPPLDNSFNCQLYPAYCDADGNVKRTMETDGKYELEKAFHPKSVVHIRTAEYIKSNFNAWQLEPGGCPCEP